MSNIVPYNDMKLMANDVARSGMFGFKSVEQASTLMLIAQSEGIHPVRAMAMYDIINGKPALKSNEILARFQDSGGSVEWIETTDKIAKGKFTHPRGGSITIEWTMQRAVAADLANKDNWKKFPSQMLRARCVTEAVRAIYPRCLNNMYSVEEVQDEIGYTDAVVIENNTHRDSVGNLKKKLANKLKEMGFNSAMVKEFAEKNNLADDEELLNSLCEDKDLLIKKIEEFENGN